jgi:hypothetical protein
MWPSPAEQISERDGHQPFANACSGATKIVIVIFFDESMPTDLRLTSDAFLNLTPYFLRMWPLDEAPAE